MSLNVGLSSSLTNALCVGLNAHEGGADVPATLLADFDFSTPLTSWTADRTGFSSSYATDEWLMQDQTVAGSYDNNVGSATMDNTAPGLADQTAVGIHDGTDYVSRGCWESLNAINAGRLICSDQSVGDPAGGDFCVRVVFRILNNAAGDAIIARRDITTGIPGWAITINAAGVPSLLFADASTSVAVPLTSGLADGAWHYITFWWDETAGDLFIKTDLDSEQSSLATGISDPDCTLFLCANASWSAHTNSGCQQQLGYLGLCVGANAQAMYDEVFWQQGGDPTSLLTTQTRASLISVPVSATQVAHFADDTLPIGYNANFSDADKMGLYTNSAITNLLTYSELLSNWTSSNMTETDSFGDSPDGFRAATKLAATADNGYSAETFTTVAATEYTLSCYVKEITVGCTGRVIFYDETGATELASQVFTCTAANQLISVTATTNAGQVSSSMRIEIDTNTEECYAMLCQANLGDKRGAYIRTAGSSAALAQCDFEAVGTAGQFADASQQGEMEVIWAKGLTTAVTPYVCAFGSPTALQNAKLHINASQVNVQFWNWDSASGAASSITVATGDPFAENLDILQWDPAGGLSAAAGAEAAIDHDSGAAEDNEVGTYTGTDTLTRIQIGNAVHTSSAPLDGYIQRIRTWDGER